MSHKKGVYIVAPSYEDVEASKDEVGQYALQIQEKGHIPILPASMEKDPSGLWQDVSRQYLDLADIVFVPKPEFMSSKTQNLVAETNDKDLPVVDDLSDVFSYLDNQKDFSYIEDQMDLW